MFTSKAFVCKSDVRRLKIAKIFLLALLALLCHLPKKPTIAVSYATENINAYRD